MDEGLDDLALVTHVGDHRGHVVIRGTDYRRPEHQGHVPRLHLVHFAVLADGRQVPDQVPQGTVMGPGQLPQLKPFLYGEKKATHQVSQFM